MDNGTIASRYARAIFAYTCKTGSTVQVRRYFDILRQMLRNNPRLNALLANPVLDAGRKEQVIMTAAGAGTDPAFTRIIRLILSHKRETHLQWIALHLDELYKKKNNELDILLTTAAPLDEETSCRIRTYIDTGLHCTALMHTTVDPSLIGGFTLEWDSYRYDASLRARLKHIQQQLIVRYDGTDKNQ